MAKTATVRFETGAFEREHGKAPRGVGTWAFCDARQFGRPEYLDGVVWHTGAFADAKRVARGRFAGRASVVIVCP